MKNWFSTRMQELKQGFQNVFKGYLLEFIISILFALSFIITNIFFEQWQETHIRDFYFCFPICFGVVYAINIFTQNTKLRFFYFISFLIIPLCYFLKIDVSEKLIVGIISTILLIYIAKKRTENIYFSSTIIQTLISIFISIVLSSICIGLLFAILRSVEYIFELDFDYNNYQIIFFAFSYLIVSPILLLIFDTKNQRKVLGEKLDTILIKYILTPAFYIFGIILYVYFAKILITFSLPKGVVSATAIGFLMLGLIIKTSTDSYEKPFQKWFFKYFSFYSIPALIMLWIATMRRILEYGFTIPRVYLLLCVITLSLWLIALVFKRTKKYYYLTIVSIVLFNLFTYIPYIDAHYIARYSQRNRPLSEKQKLDEEQRMYYLSNPVNSFDITNYKKLVYLENDNSVEKSWFYSSTENKIEIYNEEGELVFEEDNLKFVQQQLKKIGISEKEFIATVDKQELVNKSQDKFFIRETPTMTLVFSNINFQNNLKGEISIYIKYILIK
ncbi:MAG: hypothetical protein H6Q16_526 [Bacteroidetes bacterium]|nr:hypothetical protein [Bacteroidota bacterium]